MTTPRKHHKVPQSLLRQFVVPDRPKQIQVYDKEHGRSYLSAIRDTGAERDFYAVGTGASRRSWEPAFQLLDDRLAGVLRELDAANDLSECSDAVRADVLVLVATQLLRTQLQRTSLPDLIQRLNTIGESLGVERIDLSEEENRLLHLQRLLGIERVAEALGDKDVVLLQSTDAENALWISDNPVVLHNTFPYGRIGLAAPGIEIYFPISPMRCLALYCPSIGEQVRESLNPDHPRPKLQGPFYEDLLRGIESGSVVAITAEFVSFLNELQIRQSSQYLFSATADFSLAELVLSTRPSLGMVTSLFEMGELGSAAPLFKDMPPGTFLLLEHGHSHHVLPVIDCSGASGRGGIAVKVLDEMKLRTIDAAVVFDAATLIVDGHALRQMREVALAVGQDEGDHLVLVIHADRGL